MEDLSAAIAATRSLRELFAILWQAKTIASPAPPGHSPILHTAQDLQYLIVEAINLGTDEALSRVTEAHGLRQKTAELRCQKLRTVLDWFILQADGFGPDCEGRDPAVRWWPADDFPRHLFDREMTEEEAEQLFCDCTASTQLTSEKYLAGLLQQY